MPNVKKILILTLAIIVILEFISFVFFKLNLLEISHTPKIYLDKGFIPNDEWWTEKDSWGAWHKPLSSTLQKRSCYEVIYTSNEVGARDTNFEDNTYNDVVLIGDSFAEGYGVNYKNTSQKYIEDLTKKNVLNFGVSQNFGPVQYWIVYDKFASKYKHNLIIIYFLPDNDFGENDYSNWEGSKRYRPYYKKISENKYDTFIPINALKNYMSFTKKLKKILKDNFWTSNLFVNLNYKYKIYRYNKKKKNNNFSGYFDSSIEQQKAAIFFLDKIINSSSVDVILVSIPRPHDFKRYFAGESLEKTYWNNYFSKKDKLHDQFKFIDLIKFAPKNINEIFLKCDGHWSSNGNRWASKIIAEYLENK